MATYTDNNQMTGNSGAGGDTDSSAIARCSRAFRSDVPQQEMVDYYDNWAWAEQDDFDTVVSAERCQAPEETAHRVKDFFPESERPQVRVLDVAAGTGQVGVKLYNAGFRHIDALDPSEGMLKKAKARGVYTNHIQDFIGDDHRVPVDNDYYDAITVTGGLGPGHIPASAMDEMIRVVRKGGLICITMREEFLLNQPEYQQKIDQLETNGKWKLTSKELLDNYLVRTPGYALQLVVL